MTHCWPVSELGPLCTKIGSGATPRGGKEAYKSEGIALIRSQNVYNDGFNPGGLAYIDETQAAKLNNVAVEPNDVLLNITGDSVARSCSVPNAVLPARVNQHVAIVRPNPALLVPAFLRYILIAPEMQTHLLLLASAGATRNALTKAMIEQLQIPLPSRLEQQAIAEILGALDDKIELNRQMNRTLDELARTIFRSWFVDFDPVRAKAEGREPFGMDAETAALFPDRFTDSELGPIPRGWQASTLGSVVDIHDSKRIPLSSRQRAERQGPYPYYGATSVMDHVDDYLFDGIYVLVGEDGSVVNGDGTPVVQYVWGKFWVNNHAHVLTAKSGVSNEHLLLALRHTNIRPFVTGAVQAKLNQANMKQVPCVKAPDSINAAFDAAVLPLFELFRANSEEARTLAELRDTLLPELISGRLRVPEAERAVAEVV